MVRFEYGMPVSDGLWYAGSEPGKLVYLLGDLQHVSLQRPSLGDFEAASTDRDNAMVIANWRAVDIANYLLKNWSRFSFGLPATWIWGMGSAWIWGMGIGLDWLYRWSVPLLSDRTSYCGSYSGECIWHANNQHKANVGL
jgi:hypothetical protein